MYKITWDKETGGVLLHTATSEETLGVSPRPVFYEELDLLELNKFGWIYPHCKEPLMWAVNKQYWYKGQHIFDVKGADIYTAPTVVFCEGITPMKLEAVNVDAMLRKNSDLMFVLENEAIEFIRDTYTAYTKANRTYSLTKTNQLDYEALASRAEKKNREKMAVVKQDCDSFDVMPLTTAQKEGKRVLLSTKIDRFIASFSGGKDSQVVLDLCTRAIPPTAFEVIYSDTGYELPSSLELYAEVQKFYKEKFPSLKFSTARNHESVLNYWDKIGTPSDTHRWCCTIMKTAPLYRTLKVEGNKQARVLTFDGVRAEESTRRSNYARFGKGKHTFVYNAHPILKWNSVEIFLYLFKYKLHVNCAYRNGKARVGCLICPFSTSWDDMITKVTYPKELAPFEHKIRTYANQIQLADFNTFMRERRWKLKAIGNNTQHYPNITFKATSSSVNFEAQIQNAWNSICVWLPALCEITIRNTKVGISGELHYKSKTYRYEVSEKDNITDFKVYDKPTNDLIYLLRRLIYKTAYCISCEACEVDCPTGALTIAPSVSIDKNKCIHCHKCYETHDRGCIAADCIRMINDTEKKLNAKVQGYKTFGLRDEWVEEFFLNIEDFWKDNSLGTAQVNAFKAWLRDAEITDNKNNITPLGMTLKSIYNYNPILFWELVYINLSYHSFIVKWVCNNIKRGETYSKKYIKEKISNQGFTGSLSTIENAAAAFVDLAKKSPIGEDLCQGILKDKELVREAYDDLSIEAIAYSVYRFAKTRDLNMIRVSDFYNPNESHGVFKEFGISKETLLRKLRYLSSEKNRVLIAELTMGLDHITLREDLTPLNVIQLLTK